MPRALFKLINKLPKETTRQVYKVFLLKGKGVSHEKKVLQKRFTNKNTMQVTIEKDNIISINKV